MAANILINDQPEAQISRFLALIGQPARIQILLTIGAEEACVCHLEAVTGMRQASISQHLMVLRKAGLVTAHRDGRNIFYRLSQAQVTDLLERAAQIIGIAQSNFQALAEKPVLGCPCPKCNPDTDPALTCQNKQQPAKRR